MGIDNDNQNLPLTDLHRHLDGNIRTQTIPDLGTKFGVKLPANNIIDLTPHVQIVEAEPSLVAFLSKTRLGCSWRYWAIWMHADA